MNDQKEKGLKQKLLLGGLVSVLSLAILTTCIIVMLRANKELTQTSDIDEDLSEDDTEQNSLEDDVAWALEDDLDEEDAQDDTEESQVTSNVQTPPNTTSSKQYKKESYVWLLHEDRLAYRTGDIFVYVESPENINDAIMLRIVGEDLYIVSRNEISIIGNNGSRVATVSEHFVNNFLSDLGQFAPTFGKGGYWYFYDSEEDTTGELSRNQKQRLYEYCIALQAHAQGKLTREEYDAIIAGITGGM